MRLDVNDINNNYIMRLVILAVFMYKEMRKQEHIYQEYIRSYIQKRLGYDPDIKIEVGPKMDKIDGRDQIINDILDDVDDEDRGVYNLVSISFKTGHKDVNMQINLNEEDKYESYIYG